MKYLKIVNCPLRSCLQIKDSKIDWAGMGFEIDMVSRFSVQGHTDEAKAMYVSLLPISDESKFNSVKDDIINKINNNSIEGDSAIVVDEGTFLLDKTEIENQKAIQEATPEIV